jgi:hypothetical protein
VCHPTLYLSGFQNSLPRSFAAGWLSRWDETKFSIQVMTKIHRKKNATIPSKLIAPCGKNKVLMAPLRAALVKAGLKDVQTYIQSGNLIAASNDGRAQSLQAEVKKPRSLKGAPYYLGPKASTSEE